MPESLVMPFNATDNIRYAYFYITSGTTPAVGLSNLQPQLAVNTGVYTNAGIGTLNHMGSGHYCALLSSFPTRGYRVSDVLKTRFAYPNISEVEGTTIQVGRPLYSSVRFAESTGVMFINNSSGNLTRRNVVYTPAGRVHN